MNGRVWFFPIILLFCCLYMTGNAAADIKAFGEFEFINNENRSKDKTTGTETKVTTNRFSQLYNLQLERQIYPNLHFRGGGLFQLDRIESNSEETNSASERRITRPFLELRLRTPLYSFGGGYSKTEVKRSGTSISTERQYSELYDTSMQWSPRNLPRVSASFTHNTLYNDPKTYKQVNKLLNVDTNYSFERLSLYYGYSREDNENIVSDFSTLTQSHNGRISYFQLFSDNKIRVNTSYRARKTTDDFSGTGGGLSPVTRISGLFFPDEVLQDPPSINDGLTDGPGKRTDINLRSATVMNPIGMGLDFGLPHSVDTLFLWVDRDISEVADFFQWEIWITQGDTECQFVDPADWIPHAAISPAPFSGVQNRFEISFPAVETRCIKVVTTRLSDTDPGASLFSDIYVTELESFVTISAFGRPRTSTFDQGFRVGTQWKISRDTSLGYDVSYQTHETDPEGIDTSTLSNSVDLRHVFNRTFSGSARVMRTDGRRKDQEGERESTDHRYGATISAAWLPTFGQTLTYSGHHFEEEGETEVSNGIVLRNHALLYKGWSAYLDAGYFLITRSEGQDVENEYVRIGTHIAPHRRATLNVNYMISWSKTDDDEERRKDTANGQLFLLPFDTLSLASTLSYVKDEDETRWNHTYSGNWSPFPDGTVRLGLFYAASRSDGTEVERRESQSYGARFEWLMTQWSTLRMTYSISETETDIRKSDSNNFLANLRIAL